MGFFNNLFGSFTGKTGQKAMATANQQATGALNQGRDDAVRYTQQGYDQAQGYMKPYADRGAAASGMYANALGINGQGAQRQFYDGYQASPMQDQMARQAAQRSAAQGGGPSSGMYALAQSRVATENLNNYLAMLERQAGQGTQVAGQQAGMANAFGGNMANIHAGFGQQQAGNAINFGNAQAQQSNVFANNLLGLGGVATSFFGRPKVGGK